ncbi:phage head spike fiber domain-containing protein [Pseudomonas vancouverensis]|uniref:phage head spike fiber domain-containing protein n=1 Tax=Pseudomonas vancouverensis TaxID=95300 RepID=UPI003D02C482
MDCCTDGWLDLIGLDFFGNNLLRYANQSDASYLNCILINIFRERTTRPAMEKVLFDLTGRKLIIIEPARPADVGSYGAAVAISRASTGTFFDLNGRMAIADVNVARWDTDPVTGQGSLLIEPAATNLLLRSAEFENAFWGKNNAAVTVSAALAPDGLGFLRQVTATASTSSSIFRSIGLTASLHTESFYVKAGTVGTCSLRFFDSIGEAARATFDLISGVVLSSAGGVLVGRTIKSVGGGVYRLTLTADYSVRSSAGLAVYLYVTSATGATTGDSIFAWGAQLEPGTSATSHIPTTTTQITRAADILLNNMPAGSYGSVLLPYQAFITAFRPNGQGLPFVSGYGISTGAYSTPSRSSYGQMSFGDVTDADIYAAIDATKPIATVAWTRISS